MAVSIATLNTNKSGSVAGVVNYIEKSAEYYQSEKDDLMGEPQWVRYGQKDTFGIHKEGRDEAKDFAHLLAGVNPNKPESKLVQSALRKDRRLGTDITFSTPKSVSIVFTQADRETQKKIVEELKQASNEAVKYLSQQVKTRAGKTGTDEERLVDVDELFIRQVAHLDTREQEPSLHTHNVFCNLAKDKEGKIRCFDHAILATHQKRANEIFGREMAQRLSRLGFDIERTRESKNGRETGQVLWEIAGVNEETRYELSTRFKQITKEMDKGQSQNQAKITTRKVKDPDFTTQQIIEKSTYRIEQLREQGVVNWKNIEELRNGRVADIERKSMTEILGDLHKTKSSFSRKELEEAFLKEAPFQWKAEKIIEKAETEFFKSLDEGDIVHLGTTENGLDLYCSKAQMELEEKCLTDAAFLQNRKSTTHRLDKSVVEKSIREHEKIQGFALSDEQRQVVEFIASGSNDLALLVGKAGTGKTATAGAYIKAYEATGYKVLGTSAGQKATEKLEEETGIETHNTTKLLNGLEQGKIKLDKKSVVILDEAGMVGADHFEQIMSHVSQAGAKLIAMGDEKQLQPVGAGSTFRRLIEQSDKGQYATISEIRRQKTEQGKDMANNLYQLGVDGYQIMDKLHEQGDLKSGFTNSKQIYEAMAKAYVENDGRSKLMLAPTNQDIEALNHAVREIRKGKGELGDGVEIKNADNKRREFAVGDRIELTQNINKKGLANGEIGYIQDIRKGKRGLELEIRIDNPDEENEAKHRRVSINPSRKLENSFRHSYATTIHKSQGQGMDDVYVMGKPSNRSMMMVGYTRHKQNFTMFCRQQDVERIGKSIDQWEKKKDHQEIKADLDQAITDFRANRKRGQIRIKAVENKKDELLDRVVENASSKKDQNQEVMDKYEKEQKRLDGYKKANEKLTAEIATYQGYVAEAKKELKEISFLRRGERKEKKYEIDLFKGKVERREVKLAENIENKPTLEISKPEYEEAKKKMPELQRLSDRRVMREEVSPYIEKTVYGSNYQAKKRLFNTKPIDMFKRVAEKKREREEMKRHLEMVEKKNAREQAQAVAEVRGETTPKDLQQATSRTQSQTLKRNRGMSL